MCFESRRHGFKPLRVFSSDCTSILLHDRPLLYVRVYCVKCVRACLDYFFIFKIQANAQSRRAQSIHPTLGDFLHISTRNSMRLKYLSSTVVYLNRFLLVGAVRVRGWHSLVNHHHPNNHHINSTSLLYIIIK